MTVTVDIFYQAPDSPSTGNAYTGVDGIVVLFSNDTQLCSKALINGVKAVNRKARHPPPSTVIFITGHTHSAMGMPLACSDLCPLLLIDPTA